MIQSETEKYQNLYNAVICNDVALVNQLLQDGLDVNYDFKDLHVNRGESLLVESAANNQSEMVDTLLSHGAKINVQEKVCILFLLSGAITRYNIHVYRMVQLL